MDRVKLGRALGYGARHAAKAAMQAVDAATTPAASGPVKRVVAAAPVVQREAKRAGRSFFAPLKQFTSVIWLQVTGTFFALFAVVIGEGAWRLRGALAGGLRSAEAEKFWLYAGLCAVFVYFAVSSFVRAGRRERR
jgi:hypothetical protein